MVSQGAHEPAQVAQSKMDASTGGSFASIINANAIGVKNKIMESVEAPAKAIKNGITKKSSGNSHGAPLKFLNKYFVMLNIVPLAVA